MSSVERRTECGFSLIELLIAMVVTMIITGAMYGLLAGGQNAFRREPQLSDRQQAIRLGMARIQEDVAVAGQRLATFSQVFTPGLDGAGQMGPNGPTDILEIVASTGECPDIVTEPGNELDGVNINMDWEVPDCYPEPGAVMLIYPNGVGKPGWAHNIHAKNMKINFPQGQQPPFSHIQQSPADLDCADQQSVKAIPGPCQNPGTPPVKIAMIDVIRYQIAPDPSDGLASLWRSALGGFDDTNTVNPDDPTADQAGWRLIARGVEDLQVQYRDGNGNWLDEPALDAVTPDYSTVTQEVRVLLSARTSQRNLAGATSPAVAAAGDAVRGQLISTIVVRAALANLMKEGAEQSWTYPADAQYWH